MTARYAIFCAPEPGPLLDAAESWLGRTVDPARVAPMSAGYDRFTGNAWRYGFHATLKAPFRLADGHEAGELADRVATFAARRSPVVVPDLRLERLGAFFALVPGRAADDLHALAADVVTEFDDLRAPLTAADRERRRPERLDARERELLEAWGYPYVLDRFRFHLTLTDPVPAAYREELDLALRKHFAAVLGRDLWLRSLALFVEPEPGKPFLLVSSFPFGKGAP